MKRFQLLTPLFLLLLSLFSVSSHMYAETTEAAETTAENLQSSLLQSIGSLYVLQAGWTFSGTVMNESGERYHYFFEIQRNNNQYQGVAALIDGQSKQLLFYEEGESQIEQAELTKRQAGNLFIRFNPISSTWVFGVHKKTENTNLSAGVKGKKGFNFKIDTLETANTPSKKQVLREGILSLINQTGRLNGHLIADDDSKEEFVTAKKTWFRQIWVAKPQKLKHSLTAILCEFNDGAALYSLTLPEMDALKASIAGRRNAEGSSLPVSQFLSVEEGKDGLWKIRVPSAKNSLLLENLLSQKNDNKKLVLGLTSGLASGFCAINKNEIDVLHG